MGGVVLEIAPEAERLGASYAPFAVYQAISEGQLRASQQRGGNVLGLSAEDGPMILMHFPPGWDDEALDEVIEQRAQELVRAGEKNRENGVHRDFVYINYGGKWQDVLKRYGAENYSHLLKTSKKYDPCGALQKLLEGYFKLY